METAAPANGYRTTRQLEKAKELPQASDALPQYGGHGYVPGSRQEEGFVDRISHLVLGVGSLDRSEHFYNDVMGMDIVGRGLMAEQRPHAVLRMNTGCMLVLVEDKNVVPRRLGTNAVHHAFTMTPNQYRRLLEKVKEHEIDVWVDRAQYLAEGEFNVNFRDPDDHALEVCCDAPEASEVILPNVGTIDCGPADSFKVGDVKLFKEADVFLVRVKEGFLAMSRWCTHMNGRIIWNREHWRFQCPYHHATFDRCGNATGGQPDIDALRLYPVNFSPEGHALVDTSQVIHRACFEPQQASKPPKVAVTA
ncbi:MAG: Rieske 2Fe-2S domain-containing protein [Chloroflexi bacterium]|nr:Rieske 2Fe-2S domain-containing protein [Chloroflexota bacterium]